MADSAGTYLSRIQEKQVLRAVSTSDGRYIPHSGGLMGWHGNEGVLDCEIPNNYRFYTVIRAQEVRAKLFGRWNEGEKVSRRSSKRLEHGSRVEVELVWNGQTAKGRLRDFSSNGMKVTIQQQELDLQKGARPNLRIMKSANADDVEFEAAAEIMWITSSGRERTVWGMGMMYTDIPPHESARLKELLK